MYMSQCSTCTLSQPHHQCKLCDGLRTATLLQHKESDVQAGCSPLRQVEVELDGAALPLAANGVLNLDVNLGPIERTT
jgi:hypothetical protein